MQAAHQREPSSAASMRAAGTGTPSRCTWVAPCRPCGGAVRTVWTSARTGKLVLPTDVVARQGVPVGGQFHFRLLTGRYVVDYPRYVGGNVGTRLSVTVRRGEDVHADLPDMCRWVRPGLLARWRVPPRRRGPCGVSDDAHGERSVAPSGHRWRTPTRRCCSMMNLAPEQVLRREERRAPKWLFCVGALEDPQGTS
jgi:hypothetical protein